MTNSIVLSAINAVNGCKFFNLTYFADCGFPKKSGLDGIVKKVVIKSAQINYSYENAVNNRKGLGVQPLTRFFLERSKKNAISKFICSWFFNYF